MTTPLAERMRPQTLDDFIGQEHLLDPQSAFRRMVDQGHIQSMIFWGPPGVGKTSLALAIAKHSNRPFEQLSAINSGVKDVRATIEKARKKQFFDSPSPVLFIDEIHRFSKSQQDSLLQAVEQGIIILIGATTENPSFEVNAALLSRCQVYTLHSLTYEALRHMLIHAIQNDAQLRKRNIVLEDPDLLIKFSGGDARKLFNGLEIVVSAFAPSEDVVIDESTVNRMIHEQIVRYDKSGEQHYDLASAMIKSIRGSDPNAAVYYLARMLSGGEDIKFIARRLIISASEDIGLANPNALLMATQGMHAAQFVGLPEGRIILSQVAIYLACSPKGNSSYNAINQAMNYVQQHPDESVPLHLRNAPTALMKNLGYGKDYDYVHNHPGHFRRLDYFPEESKKKSFFDPDPDTEKRFAEFMQTHWQDFYKL